jgi:hypothetical protein
MFNETIDRWVLTHLRYNDSVIQDTRSKGSKIGTSDPQRREPAGYCEMVVNNDVITSHRPALTTDYKFVVGSGLRTNHDGGTLIGVELDGRHANALAREAFPSSQKRCPRVYFFEGIPINNLCEQVGL